MSHSRYNNVGSLLSKQYGLIAPPTMCEFKVGFDSKNRDPVSFPPSSSLSSYPHLSSIVTSSSSPIPRAFSSAHAI
jgi:hypothetical protein